MNSKERFMNRLKGKAVDRAPNCNLIMGFAPRYINKPLSEFFLDYRVLVEANLKVASDFGIDVLGAISDPYREVFDYGVKVEFPHDNIPLCKEILIKGPEDLKKVKPFDPYNSTRILDRLKAIELYKKETGNEYAIMGWVEGAFAEAVDLRGLDNTMMDLYDEPEMLKELMEICLKTEIDCAVAQLKAGADLIGIGDAAASLIGRNMYKEYVFEYEKKLIDAIHKEGGLVKLHICGNITNLLEELKHTGADIIDTDWMVDFKAANEIFDGYAATCGNFDPVAVIKDGTPETVKQAVWNCLDQGNNKTMIMAGCEIPVGTPHENLKAVHQALKEYGY